MNPDRELDRQVVQWRRHLHSHPEPSFQETATARFVESTLRAAGLTDIVRPTPTSVVARLKGRSPGRRIALRADIDALPITEQADHDYVSSIPGVMHACGHDGHTAILLGVARLLRDQQDALSGEIHFVFQHGEEHLPGGAGELVELGVMDGVEAVVGLHLWADLDVGSVAVRAGPAMASLDVLEIDITGHGGHAAQPHLSTNPVAVAAHVISGLQGLVPSTVDPLRSAVVAMTAVQAGRVYNVVPERANLLGTVRALDGDVRLQLAEAVPSLARSIASAHGAGCEIEYKRGYAPVVNDAAIAAAVRDTVDATLGAAALVEMHPTMASDDFSAFLARAPGAYFFVGVRNERLGIVHPHHSPRFDIDERALGHGLRVLARVAQALARGAAV